MTRTLILIRHAKSSWDNPALDDHERPLNKRGKRAATALGEWLRGKGWAADQVLSSDSARTRETYARLAMGTKGEFTRDLYHAGPDQMRQVLSHATGDQVMMLGHNPGIAGFAAALAHEPPQHPRFADYPSGATVVLRFDVDSWADVVWGTGKVMDFVVPRDLPET